MRSMEARELPAQARWSLGVVHLDAKLLRDDLGQPDPALSGGLLGILHIEHVGEHLTPHARVEEAVFVFEHCLPHRLEKLMQEQRLELARRRPKRLGVLALCRRLARE